MRKAILIVLLMIAPNLFSQDNESQEVRIVNHQVMMGETVRMLSKKYLVPPSEIYKLNKFAVDGISTGMIIKIPVPVKQEVAAAQQDDAPAVETRVASEVVKGSPPLAPETSDGREVSESATMVTHKVASGETLSGLAAHYGLTIDAIKEANPKVAKRGLRADENIAIPVSGGIVPSNEHAAFDTESKSVPEQQNGNESGQTIRHEVQAGETLIGLAKKYNVTAEVIKRQNPRVAKKGLQAGQVLKITAE